MSRNCKNQIDSAYSNCENWFKKNIKKGTFLDNPEKLISTRNEFAEDIYRRCDVDAFRREVFDCIERFKAKNPKREYKQLACPEVWLLEVVKSLMPVPLYASPEDMLKLHEGYDGAVRTQLDRLSQSLKDMSGLTHLEVEKQMPEGSSVPWDAMVDAVKGAIDDLDRGKETPKKNKPLSWEQQVFCAIIDDFKRYFPSALITGSPKSFCHAIISLLFKHARYELSEKQMRSRINYARLCPESPKNFGIKGIRFLPI